VGPELAALFERVRATGAPVLAVDVPSGLDADRADVDGDVLTATWTLQLSAVKPASLLPPARDRYGAWWIDDLGLDAELSPPTRSPTSSAARAPAAACRAGAATPTSTAPARCWSWAARRATPAPPNWPRARRCAPAPAT
jgi:hypothetical protein